MGMRARRSNAAAVPIARMAISVTRAHRDAVARQYRAGHLVTGPAIDRLEHALARAFHRPGCCLTSSGFAALALALSAIGVRERLVIVPAASTCFALVNAVRFAGGRPVYADLDAATANLSPESVAAWCTRDRRIAAIVSPNHFGILSNVTAAPRGVPIIEDCAPSALSSLAIGMRADVGILSFYPTKLLDAIDGGAVLSTRDDVLRFARDRVYYAAQHRADEPARFNFRLANVHAAHGLVSLARLPAVRRRIEAIGRAYRAVIGVRGDVGILGSGTPGETVQRVMLRLPDRRRRDRFVARMRRYGVECGCDLRLMDPDAPRVRTAAALVDATCSLPTYESLRPRELATVCEALAMALKSL